MTAAPAATCLPIYTPAVFSGPLNGNNITLTSPSVQGRVMTIEGTSRYGSNIDGTYRIAGGTGSCNGDLGTVSGVLLPAIDGDWTGTVVEVPNPPPDDPYIIPNAVGITASIKQGDANSKGNFPLSGTVKFSNTTCIAPVDLPIDSSQSYIAGSTVHLVVTPDASSTVAINGALTNLHTAVGISVGYGVSGGACSGYYSSSGTLTKVCIDPTTGGACCIDPVTGLACLPPSNKAAGTQTKF
jgi:hypothetical protein